MGQKEKKIINERLKNLSDNERLFRINAGMGWVGKIVKKTDSMLLMKNPRPFYGAPDGWLDLSGWTQVEITPDMVGKKVAIFTAEEIKATGKLSDNQEKFKNIIKRMGGIFRVIDKA